MLLVPYLGVVLVITVTPGPDTGLVIRHSVRAGLRAALATAAGCALGLLVWGTAAAVGVTALVTASHAAGTVLRVAGACYLAVLGIGLLRSSAEPSDVRLPLGKHLPPFGQGLLNNLLNPKAAVFFTALLPQFLPRHGPTFVATLFMAVIAAAAELGGLSVYAALAHRARAALANHRRTAMLDRVTGATFVALGARLALSHDR